MRKGKHQPSLNDRGGKFVNRPGGRLTNSWLYGLHAVRSALANPQRKLHRLLATDPVARSLGRVPIAPEIVGREAIDAVVPRGAVHQGIALLAEPLPEPDFADAVSPGQADRAIVLVLDQVTDPHNVGAILRSSAAFGAKAVVVTERNTPDATATLAKAASGALDVVPVARVVNLARAIDDLKKAGYWCVGFADGAEKTLVEADLTGHVALVFGAEGEGLRRLTAERCDQLLRIPTANAMASLNVSNAVAVALYELARWR